MYFLVETHVNELVGVDNFFYKPSLNHCTKIAKVELERSGKLQPNQAEINHVEKWVSYQLKNYFQKLSVKL